MKRKLLSLLFLLPALLFGAGDYAIVFVHIGNEIPPYAIDSLQQARLFNPDCPIYFIANDLPLKNFPLPPSIQPITCESLIPTDDHKRFLKYTHLNNTWRGGFIRYTVERFFYLNDFIQQNRLHNVFHLENDVLLYVNLADLLPQFQTHYAHIGATFDNDDRCIPGFIYSRQPKAMDYIAHHFAQFSKTGVSDMYLMGLARDFAPDIIQLLPVTTRDYVDRESMVTRDGQTTSNKYLFCNHFDAFHSLFDAAAYGQYLGGDDPRNKNYGPGWVNEASIYNPSLYTITFKYDDQLRLVPYATYNGTTCRINNLHIHCKDLKKFTSHRE